MSVKSRLYNPSDYDRVATIVKSGEEKYRTSFRRDFARLIHCPSFRRLQGKTQVFPGYESDFFRNRLTHSLEVAQIAKSIAIKLNATSPYFAKSSQKIDTDLVEFAGLAHDLGHPPFGHNGEEALDECMIDHGGFEGNAQTLRIISRIEKKETIRLVEGAIQPIEGEEDLRCGLNVSYRALAAILKYNRIIPCRAIERDPNFKCKGYYADQANLIQRIKLNVLNGKDCDNSEFKTIECSIMDVADDIAYSTYDLEDAFKAFFATPMFLIVNESVFEKAAETIKRRIDESFAELSEQQRKFSPDDIPNILIEIFEDLFSVDRDELTFLSDPKISVEQKKRWSAIQATGISRKTAYDGYERTKKTSKLVQTFIAGIEVKPHKKFPQLHKVRLKLPVFKQVEVLKNLIFESVIKSPNMQFVEYRGKDIVKEIFSAIESGGDKLLPEDYRHLFKCFKGTARKRTVCDFIAGMTDRYAIEFYTRLYGTNPQTIHKPV